MKKNKPIEFVNWIISQGYQIDKETNLWSFSDLPFLWTTEDLYKIFIDDSKGNKRNR